MRLISRLFVATSFLAAVSSTQLAFAQPSSINMHYSGGDISVVPDASGDSLIVTLQAFYNCPTGVAIPATTNIFTDCPNASHTLNLITNEEITDVCAATFPECGGTVEAERRLVYQATLAKALFTGCSPARFIVFPVNRNNADNVTNVGASNDRLRIVLEYFFALDSTNSTPIFGANGQPYVCGSTDVVFDPQVSEADGDSLVFSIEQADRGVGGTSTLYTYSAGVFPVNANDSIDPLTGILTFTAPADSGFYQIVIEVNEYDRATGALISVTRRDFQFFVDGACSNAGPTPAASLSALTNAVLTSNYTVTIDSGDAASFALSFTGDIGETVSLTSTAGSFLNGATTSTSTASNTTTMTVNWTATQVGTFYFTIAAEDNNCDIKGKGAERITVIVPDSVPPTPLQITGVVSSNETCPDSNNGSIDIQSTGGIGPLSFDIFGFNTGFTDTQTNGLFEDLAPDFYIVSVGDSGSGFDTTFNVTVLPSFFGFLATPFNQIVGVTCDDACNGDARSRPNTFGTTPYTYLWSNGETTVKAFDLCGGSSVVSVTDATGCTISDTVALVEPPSIYVQLDSSFDVTCNGGNDGQAFLSAYGGVAAPTSTATYVLDQTEGEFEPYGFGEPFNTNNSYSKVSLGDDIHSTARSIGFTFSFYGTNYTQFVIGSNGYIALGNSLAGTFSSFASPTMPNAGAPNNIIAGYWEDLNPSLGGTIEYYTIGSAPDRALVVNFIDVGHYVNASTVGNPVTFQIVLYENSNIIQIHSTNCPTDGGSHVQGIEGNGTTQFLTPAGRNNTSFSLTNDYVSFIPTTQNFSYTWSSIGSGASATNLTAGPYTVTATDGDGCNDTVSFTILEAPAIVIDTVVTHPGCAGDTNGSITASASGGNGGPYTYLWSTGATTATISNLAAGVYTVTATDVDSCQENISITLVDPAPVVANINVDSNVSCFGGSNGQLTASGSGGDGGPYTFLWTTTATSATISNLIAGTYGVTVTDGNGCTDTTSATVTEPATALSASIVSSTNLSCPGDSSGSATAGGAGGTPPYTFAWSSGGTAATENNLPSGTFIVTVTDNNGCTDTTSVTITEPAGGVAITIASVTDVSCNGDSDGSITANAATGGTGPYTYLWSSGGSGLTEGSLPAGAYTITATDNNGCEATADTVIGEPAVLIVDTTAVTNPTCAGAGDGSITVASSGGTPAYSLLWSTGATSNTINSLSAGTYSVTVTDANGCTDDISINLTNGAGITASINIDSAISCNGASDGQLTASATGTAPFTFVWSPSGITPTITGLAAGTYSVTVTDVNGCADSTSETLTQPTALVASITSSTNVSCNGGTDGEATAAGSGGTAPYTFLWSSGDNTATTTSGLSAGTYIVTVTDNNGCTDTASVVITEPATSVSVVVTGTNVSCFGASDGTVTATPSGGTSPYTYIWNTGGTSQTLTGLSAGTYNVTVTDDNGCTATGSTTISQPAFPLIATTSIIDSITCVGANDGEIFGFGFGGTAPYTYLWNTGDTVQTISGLGAGSYTVTVTDANGCTDADTRVLTAPAAVIASIDSFNNVTCFGDGDGEAFSSGTGGTTPYTFAWSSGGNSANETGLSGGTVTVTITDDNGCIDTASVTILEPAVLVANIDSSNNISCNGDSDGEAFASGSGGTAPYTFAWSSGGGSANETGLPAGTYTVTVTDANGCTDTETVTITEPATGVSVSIASVTDVTCNGDDDGSITANAATGGTGPYTYLWSSGGTTLTIGSLAPGSYTITATDANGCTATADTSITEPTVLVLDTTSTTDPTCGTSGDGSITIAATGGTPVYTYLWSTGATTTTVGSLNAGTYTVTVTDANGCQDDISVTLNAGAGITASITVDSTISCNGGSDGQLTATSDGTLPFTFAWTPVGNTATITNLAAGSYSVTVTDANGCIDSAVQILTEPTAITVSISASTDVSCFNGSDGSATASASGGTAPYNFQWSNGDTGPTTTTGLPAGTFGITVTDAAGCQDSATVTINQPIAAVDPNAISSDVTCFGLADGTASAAATGGTSPYTYTWSTGDTAATITGLSAGTYFVTAEDDNGCTDVDTVTIGSPTTPLIATTSIIDSISCDGAADGEIFGFAFGGTAPYTYLWNIGDTTQTISGLSAGTYTVTVTDANGCTDADTRVMTAPPAVTLGFTTNDPSCAGVTNGSVVVTPSGGTPPYTYLWSTGGTTDSIGGLGAGTYVVTVTDDNGCTAIDSATLTNGAGVTASVTFNSPSCNGENTGFVIGSGIGGTLPFSYSWSFTASTGNFQTGLGAGTYSLTVTDGNGCSDDTTFTLIDPPALSVSIIDSVNPTCAGNDGSLQALGAGGTGSLSYLWSTGGTTDTIMGLAAGFYSVTVEDSLNCLDSTNITLVAPTPPTASAAPVQHVTCATNDGEATVNVSSGTAPFSFSWSNGDTTQTITGLDTGTYTVTVTDINNCQDTSMVIIIDTCACNWSASASVITNPACAGDSTGVAVVSHPGATAPITYAWSNGSSNDSLIGVPSGTYTVTVTDANACTDTSQVTLTAPAAIVFSGFTNVAHPSCDDACDGTAMATATGGTGGLTYLWPSGATSQMDTGLCGGGHTVTITDGAGCTLTETVGLVEPPSIWAVVDSTSDVNCNGDSSGAAFISAYGGFVAPTSTSEYIIDQTEGEFEPYPKGQPWNAIDYQVLNLNDDDNSDSIEIFSGGSFSFFGQTKNYMSVSSQGLVHFDMSQINTGQVNGMYSTTNAIPFNGNNQDPRDFIGAYWHDLDPSVNTESVIETYVLGSAPERVRVVNYIMIDHFGAATPIFSSFQIAMYETSNIIQIHSDSLRSDGGNHVMGIENAAENAAYAVTGRNNTNFEADNDYVAFIPTTQNFTYTWSSVGSGPSSTNLPAGSYTVTAADGVCSDTVQFTIDEPATGVSASIVSTTSPTCAGGSDGQAIASATGGTGPYTFVWSSGSTTDTAANIMAGPHTVTVTDATGCTDTATTTISDGISISVAMSSTMSLCVICNGTATASVAGGSTPYNYLWTNGSNVTNNNTSHTITNLCSGPYGVTVTDGNGCQDSNAVTVNDLIAPPVTANGSNVTCNGACDGTAVASYSFCTGCLVRWYTGTDTTNQIGTGDSISGLCAGTYLVRLTTGFNCSRYDTLIITEPAAISLATTSTDASCSGGTTGTATVSASGGTAPITFLWSTNDTSSTITGLTAGNYTVTATDANGCQDSATVTILAPSSLTATIIDSADASCDGGSDGSAEVQGGGGTTPYSFLWDNGETAATAVLLDSGQHCVTITDDSNCTAVACVTISDPDPMTFTFNETPVSCGGSGNDGQLTVVPGGATPPYVSYTWNISATTATITGLSPGTYCVTVTDANGCQDSACYVMAAPGAFTVDIVDSADVLCFGDPTGYAVVQVIAGGSGNYNYLWSNGSTTDTVSNLLAGTHSVTVTDATTSCVDSATIFIDEPTQLLVVWDSVFNVNCLGGSDGLACASGSGGTPPYTYSWSNGANSQCMNNVPAGTYTLTITDANGCVAIEDTTITEPATGVVASVTQNTTPLCDGDSASVTASATGGSGTYTFLWPTGETTPTVNLPAGTWCVTVSDGGVCTDTACVIITDPDPISISFTSTDPTCPDGNDGTITANPSGGTPPYVSYLWNTGATTQSINGLPDGCYDVTVTDANGCTNTATHCINDPAGMTANFTNVNVSSCGTCNGSATANISNGTAPFGYLWSNGGTNQTGTNLCAGINGLTVTDANGCVDSFNVNVPSLGADTVTALTLSNASCNGGSDGVGVANYVCTVAPCVVEWYDISTNTLQGTTDTVTGLSAGDYYVQLTNDSGCVSFDTITITEPSPVVATITASTNVSCLGGNNGTATVAGSGGTPGYTFEWPSGSTNATETGLSAGTYCVTVYDANDCEDTACVIIYEPATGLSVTGLVISNVTCNGGNDGSVTAMATGGSGTYTYTWNGTTVADTLFNQSAGTYIVVADDGGPCTATDTVEIVEPTPVTGTFSNVADPDCPGDTNGAATVTGSGGNGGYTYQWPSGNTGQTETGLSDGTYCVTITDASGCSDTVCVIITDPIGLTTNFTGITASSCTVCDGTATANPSGGNGGPFTYLWSNGQTTATNDSLCAGINTVTITDAAGCTSVENVLINADGADTVTAGGTNPTCGSCDGMVFATYNCSVAPCTVEWTNLGTGGTVGTTDTIQNLCEGTYAVELTNGDGCVSVDSITINAPDLIDPNETINDVTCFGACNGSISLNPTGGSGTYTYAWSNSAGNVSSVSNLCAGLYTVTIQDGAGCDTIIDFNIDEPTEIVTNANVSDASCADVCDGQVLVNPTGGAGSYTYNWNPTPNNGNGLNLADSLCAGTYFLTITDGDGCTKLDTFEILQPDAIVQDTVIVTDATCGDCDGSVDPTFSGGAGGFSYNWTTGSTNDSIAGLCFGYYEVTVTDGDGCTGIFGYPVSETTGPVLNMTSTNATANGQCDGTATADTVSAAGPVTWIWSNGDTTTTADSLCAGFYIVTVTDANGCSTVDTITITEPDELLLDFNITEISCNGGGCDGAAEAVVTGGVQPYTYAWSTGDTTALISGLCAGTYTVTVTDASAQIIIDSVTIEDPQPFNIASTVTAVSCPGECDGSIDVVITGGAPPYTILWNTGDTSTSLSNLCAGTYIITISDTAGCSDSVTFTINEPAPLVAVVDSLTNPTCGLNDGVITVTATGGNGGPYSYLWLDVAGDPLIPTQNTNIATGLFAGIYNVQMIDANGCIDTGTVILNNINAPTITLDSIVDVSCFGECDGAIMTTITGGVMPYMILWASGDTTADADSLCAGNDTIAVIDADGCAAFDIYTVETPEQLQLREVEIVDVTCGANCDGSIDAYIVGGTKPYTYTWSNGATGDSIITDLCAGLYSLTLTDANNCELIVPFNVDGPDSIVIMLDSLIDATCTNTGDGGIFVSVTGGTAPLSYQWIVDGDTLTTQDLQGVLFGTYTFIVTDANGCSVSDTFDVDAEFFVDVTAMDDIEVCPQSLDIFVTGTNDGGTQVRWLYENGTIAGTGTSITVGTFEESSMFVIEGINGVCVDRDTVFVNWTEGTGINAGPDVSIEPGESVTIGGNPTANSGVELVWSPATDISSVTAYNPTVDPLITTVYYVSGTDLDDCFGVDSVIVTVEELIGPNDGFSPNGDGVNDYFVIDRIEDYPNAIVQIFNRWGNLIYESPAGYISDPWDGTYSGKELPVGSYYFVIDLNDDAVDKLITGPVTILK